MKTREKWYAGGVLALVAASLVAWTVSANAADPAPPTLADAQAALNHIDQDQATIQAYLNSVTSGLNPSQASATAGDKSITLRWQAPTAGSPTGYVYGRDGVDSTGSGAYTSPVQPLTTTSVTLDKLVNGTTYNVFVEAVYASGNQRVSFAVKPVAAARASGLPWSSGAWADGDRTQTASFVSGPRGGVALDNQLVYASRNTQAAQNNVTEWKNQLPAAFNGATQDLVLAVTTWTGDGAYMTQAQATALGTSVCSVDPTHPVVRLDWEMNLQDGAGQNGAVLTAANYSAWVSRFRTVATALKASCSGLQIDFNINQGTDQTTGCSTGTYAAPNTCSRQAFQALKDVIDIYGIDTYDSYPPVTSSGSGWPTRTGAANFGQLENVRAYAVANGKKFSVPEWGVACNGTGCQWAGNAGGDDPTYVHDMVQYFAAHAGDLSYETYFDETASYIVSDLISANANSRAQYKADLLASRG